MRLTKESKLSKSDYEKGGGSQANNLGKRYEEDTLSALLSVEVHARYNSGKKPLSLCESAAHSLFRKSGVSSVRTCAEVTVPTRDNGSLAKTDKCVLVNGETFIRPSIKQSRAEKVAVAELSVETINEEAFGNKMPPGLLRGMNMFQETGNMSLLKETGHLATFKETISNNPELVQALAYYLLSGSPLKSSDDNRVANYIVEYSVDTDGNPLYCSVKTIAEKVKDISGKGTFKSGFSWTYASGTRGSKIQLKAPVSQP